MALFRIFVEEGLLRISYLCNMIELLDTLKINVGLNLSRTQMCASRTKCSLKTVYIKQTKGARSRAEACVHKKAYELAVLVDDLQVGRDGAQFLLYGGLPLLDRLSAQSGEILVRVGEQRLLRSGAAGARRARMRRIGVLAAAAACTCGVRGGGTAPTPAHRLLCHQLVFCLERNQLQVCSLCTWAKQYYSTSSEKTRSVWY